tara:strand:- start:286 stop:585 length:300 start_codon:yes stop_codon:yes gene_type:complete
MGTTFYETSSDEFVMENTIELRYEVGCGAPVDLPLSTSPILRTGTTTGHKNVRTIYILYFYTTTTTTTIIKKTPRLDDRDTNPKPLDKKDRDTPPEGLE